MSNYIKCNIEIISLEIRQLISSRYKTITRALNIEFYHNDSEYMHSYYVGSYGRGTAIDSSDIDILFEMPNSEFKRFDNPYSNGQSYLLQIVKNAILTKYPRSNIRADGQVVVIDFSDGIKFEVLPAFIQSNIDEKKYRYPNTHNGGTWLSTNPLSEQDAMKNKNKESNGLLFDTCKHIRYIRDNYFSSYKLSGIVIDSFVYANIGGFSWITNSFNCNQEPGAYEKYLLGKAKDLKSERLFYLNNTLFAPGSGDKVEYDKSIDCLIKVLEKIAN